MNLLPNKGKFNAYLLYVCLVVVNILIVFFSIYIKVTNEKLMLKKDQLITERNFSWNFCGKTIQDIEPKNGVYLLVNDIFCEACYKSNIPEFNELCKRYRINLLVYTTNPRMVKVFQEKDISTFRDIEFTRSNIALQLLSTQANVFIELRGGTIVNCFNLMNNKDDLTTFLSIVLSR